MASFCSQTILDAFPYGFLLLDSEDRVVGWNHWLELRSKHLAPAVLGRTLNEIFPDRPQISQVLARLRETRQPQLLSQPFHHYFLPFALPENHMSGLSYMQQESNLTLIDDPPHHVAITITDVTSLVVGQHRAKLMNHELASARDRAQQALVELAQQKFALDQSAMVVVTDGAGTITYANEKFCAVSGYAREELIGQDHRMVNSGFHPKEFIRHLWKTISKGSIWKGEICNRTKIGSLYWVDTTIVPFLGPQGKPIQFIAIRTDITARKQSEEILRASEAKFSIAFDHAAIGMGRLSPHGDWIKVNPATCSLFGYSAEELLNRNFKDLTYPEDFAHDQIQIPRLLAGEIEIYQVENRYFNRNGQIFWGLLNLSLVRTEAGTPAFFVAEIVDITARKTSEEARISSEAKFRALFETSRDAIVLLENATFFDCNQAAVKMFGYASKEEFLKQPPGEISPPKQADGKNTEAEIQIRIQATMETGSGFFEWLHRRKDGTCFPTEVLLNRVETDGKTLLQAVVRDISARKQAAEALQRSTLRARTENRIREILLRSQDEDLYADTLDEVRKLFGSQFGFFGYLRAEDGALVCPSLTHEIWAQCSVEAKSIVFPRASWGGLWGRVLKERQPLLKNGPHQTPVGHLPLHCSMGAPILLDNELIGIIHLANGEANYSREDLDLLMAICDLIAPTLKLRFQREAHEAERRRYEAELVETSRMAGMAEVATGVLHNVGNVLNSVNVSATLVAEQVKKSKAANVGKIADMLREHENDLGTFLTHDIKGKQVPVFLGKLAEAVTLEQVSLLQEIADLQKNIEHIKDVVSMQQSYARISGVTEKVHIAELIEDTLRMNAGSLLTDRIEVQKDFAVVPQIEVDKHKLLQILVNLVRNAKHACDDSGRPDKRIVVRVVQAGERVQVSVCDNGIGIPPENLNRIFNHGFTTKKNGHGFGLHSGANAAKEMGGTLTAHSDGAGHGASFVIELPLHPFRATKL